MSSMVRFWLRSYFSRIACSRARIAVVSVPVLWGGHIMQQRMSKTQSSDGWALIFTGYSLVKAQL